MSFLLFILLVLFLLLGLPLLKGWFYMQNLRRRVNETFGSGPDHERAQRYEEEEEYTETGERKIYTSGDGEYTEFEEVTGGIIDESGPIDDTHTIIEEQVTDAEFEEIP